MNDLAFAGAQVYAAHLAGGGHRQLVDELDFAGIFVRGETGAYMAIANLVGNIELVRNRPSKLVVNNIKISCRGID